MIREQKYALIIIPDVHGRPFWRYPAVTYREARFIFLGDYLDPYPADHIKDADAFQRLQDIVAFKKSNPDRAILLWGNHDLHYLYDSIIKGSRYDEEHAERNREFFKENQDLFQMAHEEMVCGRRYLFTHAGLCEDWAINYLPDGVNTTADWMNGNLLTAEHIKSLNAVSRWRGGPNYIHYGSIIWSDAHEQHYIQRTTQVFGHTYMEDPMSDHYNEMYCLDCGRAFYLNTEDGYIYEMSSVPETPVSYIWPYHRHPSKDIRPINTGPGYSDYMLSQLLGNDGRSLVGLYARRLMPPDDWPYVGDESVKQRIQYMAIFVEGPKPIDINYSKRSDRTVFYSAPVTVEENFLNFFIYNKRNGEDAVLRYKDGESSPTLIAVYYYDKERESEMRFDYHEDEKIITPI